MSGRRNKALILFPASGDYGKSESIVLLYFMEVMVVGEGLFGAKAPHPSGRCLRQRFFAVARVEPHLLLKTTLLAILNLGSARHPRVLRVRSGVCALSVFKLASTLTFSTVNGSKDLILPRIERIWEIGVHRITVFHGSNGGGGRIRTFEVDDGRFTVCSLWPLGNPTRGISYCQWLAPVPHCCGEE